MTIYHARTETQYFAACGACTRGTGDLLTGRPSRVTCPACRLHGMRREPDPVKAARDARIREMRAKGLMYRTIAERVGLSLSWVKAICKRGN